MFVLRRSVRPQSAAATAAARLFSSSTAAPQRTALYDLHVELKGKIVDFAGWSLPVQYAEGVLKSHLHTRTNASVFDVSHMGQIRLFGRDRLDFLEKLVVADLQGTKANEAKLSVLTNAKGGIIDDCVITNMGEHVYMVVNAGCKDKDIQHMREQLVQYVARGQKDVTMEVWEGRSLLALQGPDASKVLQRLVVNEDLTRMPFMHARPMQVAGMERDTVYVSRCGYTGEDGFEISVPDSKAVEFARQLLSQPEVLPAGLGARDSLRLEAGLCLYGHDLNEDITPVEAALSWTIGKRRRETATDFPGADIILNQLKNGATKQRVGLFVEGAPAREGVELLSTDGAKIGVVTSGTFSPVLKKPIAMGYVDKKFAKVGTPILASVRGKEQKAEITKMPFVPARYYKPAL